MFFFFDVCSELILNNTLDIHTVDVGGGSQSFVALFPSVFDVCQETDREGPFRPPAGRRLTRALPEGGGGETPSPSVYYHSSKSEGNRATKLSKPPTTSIQHVLTKAIEASLLLFEFFRHVYRLPRKMGGGGALRPPADCRAWTRPSRVRVLHFRFHFRFHSFYSDFYATNNVLRSFFEF